MGRRTCVGGGGGRERGPLAVLSEMWETEYVDGGGWSGPVIGGGPGCVKTTYPPLEPAPSSFSLGRRLSPASGDIPASTQLKESTLPSPIMKTVSIPDHFFERVSPPYEYLPPP